MSCPIHTADTDATQLSSWVASPVCKRFATIVGDVGDSFDESEQICRQQSRQLRPSLQFPVLLIQSQLGYWLTLVTSDDIMTSLFKKLSASINIHVVKPLCSVSKLSTESVGSPQSSWASCELCSHRRCDATRQLRRVGVGGVYWAIGLGWRT